MKHKNGASKHPLYHTYYNIRDRCTNKKGRDYPFYGGRGIKMCDRWLNDFWAFVNDVGEKPNGKSIDRINPEGDYEPNNVRWADNSTQQKNRIVHKKLGMKKLAELTGYTPERIRQLTYKPILRKHIIGDISMHGKNRTLIFRNEAIKDLMRYKSSRI